VAVVKEVRYFLHRESLNIETVGRGARAEKRTENVSVVFVVDDEDEEDKRVYTEVTNRL
jgi:hypothetical protein